MPYLFKVYLRYPWVVIPFIVSGLIQASMWWYVVRHIGPTENQVFLHYNVILGIDLAGSWQELYYIPATGTALLLINFVAALLLFRTERIVAGIIAVTTAIWSILLFVGLYIIVGLNI